ncbi:MAG: HpaII family restriction endonuclease [Bacteroidales bacterium]|nr:HpaII family restriction endonuclease [Bacteroidales bacterium]
MALTGNKGEWSEIYTLFKLLGEKQVYAGDGNLHKIESLFYPILKVLRSEQNKNYEYCVNDKIVIVTENGTEIVRKTIGEFLVQAQNLLTKIRQSNGAFAISETEQFMNSIGCKQIKAKSVEKADIRIVIHDLRTGMTPKLGFSIKSQLGNNSTLLNAGRTTNFRYKINGGTLTQKEVNEINSIDSRRKIRDRVQALKEKGATLKYDGMDDSIFCNNLILIDSRLPEIIAEILYECYSTGNTDLKVLTQSVSKRNPLCYDISNNNPFYEYKIKQLLVAVALGMTPHNPWNGIYEANGGYLVVKEDGDVLCYHFYDRNLFEEYLFCNTMLESASTTRHNYAQIYSYNDMNFFKLNLQIRFK